MDAFLNAIAETKSKSGSGFPDLALEYSSICGERWGEFAEWETRLTLSNQGDATLFRRRGPGDSASELPGLYTGRLDKSDAMDFLDVLESSGIQNHRSSPPGPRDPVDRLELVMGGRVFRFSWGNSMPPAPASVKNLENLITNWTLTVCPTAIWNLALSADEVRVDGMRFSARLRLENQGRDKIRLVHPGSPGIGEMFELSLKYGERPLIEEGFTPAPAEIQFAKWQGESLGMTELLEVLPGAGIQLGFKANLEGAAPRGWSGKVGFKHYLAKDSIAGMPVFNGALFSEEFSW